MAETLLDTPEHDAQLTERYLQKVVSEVDRLSMITQDLLVLSAAESNPIRKQNCNLADVFRNVVAQLTPKARDKGLELIFEGPEILAVEANASQMTQVAINLIDNAINYTLSGWVHVKVWEERGNAIVTIEDSGMGIASDQLGRIFERFYRVDKARSRNTGGTGLGLSIVKHLVESHGGSIVVTSSLNEGTKFRVELPLGNLPVQP
jgi:two-component system phosphate regulon sensor histidine kinase PhoR